MSDALVRIGNVMLDSAKSQKDFFKFVMKQKGSPCLCNISVRYSNFGEICGGSAEIGTSKRAGFVIEMFKITLGLNVINNNTSLGISPISSSISISSSSSSSSLLPSSTISGSYSVVR